MIRNREGNDAYESDEEKNPYASSVSTETKVAIFVLLILFFQEEEQEEEPPVVLTAGPAIQQQQQQVEAKSQTPKAVPPRPIAPPAPGSPPASPTLSPGHGGHSVVAKRATSPKIPKPKTTILSRGNSPLGGQTLPLAGSRATSPATSDIPNGTGTNPKSVLKRKADDSSVENTGASVNVNDQHKAKKRKAPATDVTPIEVSSEELERLLVEWLKNTTGATTKDCIKHFGPYIAEKRPEFASMVRKVAQLKNGVLIYKPRGASAPSPVA